MIFYLGLVAGVVLGIAMGTVLGAKIGWRIRFWECKHTKGCPHWSQESKRAWTESWTEKYPNGKYDRRPTPKPFFDKSGPTGVPSRVQDTPTTGIANPKRRRTP